MIKKALIGGGAGLLLMGFLLVEKLAQLISWLADHMTKILVALHLWAHSH